ncbi:EAL domain-containing protein [Thiomicrorhabdus indica]|uniref:EAL domain-containing protein n=1 Tax=Thiomicrorhabdus indica TaxID=2267253 RepID=UPI00102D736C|nr:EAL domain-containing protein [Thiomicrorhabdus indica]
MSKTLISFDMFEINHLMRLVYQPIVDKEQSLQKFEVLLRLDTDPPISPQSLVDWAELEVEKMVFLDLAVLKRFYLDVQQLFYANSQFQSVTFALNVSPLTLGIDTRYVDEVTRMRHLHPEVLVEIEVLETKPNPFHKATLRENLKTLANLSIDLSIDDFGNGFDSMIKITDLYHNVKLDGQLIESVHFDRKHFEVTCSLITLCHKLGKTVTAEKVECQHQLDILCSLNCDYYQGYYFSKPLELEHVRQLPLHTKPYKRHLA